MHTLVLSDRELPAAGALLTSARKRGWRTGTFAELNAAESKGNIAYYGGTDRALAAASRFRIALIEPPLDLLARIPVELLLRRVEYVPFQRLSRLRSPMFVKPADPLDKWFDAGVYQSFEQIRFREAVRKNAPVLISEPVEWSAEFRCFIHEGRIAAWSPYISFGRPNWKPFSKSGLPGEVPAHLAAFHRRLAASAAGCLPPAFVVDIGLMDERGWGIVEFNPVWCAGLLGADPARVLSVLARACQDVVTMPESDRRWIVHRPVQFPDAQEEEP